MNVVTIIKSILNSNYTQENNLFDNLPKSTVEAFFGGGNRGEWGIIGTKGGTMIPKILQI